MHLLTNHLVNSECAQDDKEKAPYWILIDMIHSPGAAATFSYNAALCELSFPWDLVLIADPGIADCSLIYPRIEHVFALARHAINCYDLYAVNLLQRLVHVFDATTYGVDHDGTLLMSCDDPGKNGDIQSHTSSQMHFESIRNCKEIRNPINRLLQDLDALLALEMAMPLPEVKLLPWLRCMPLPSKSFWTVCRVTRRLLQKQIERLQSNEHAKINCLKAFFPCKLLIMDNILRFHLPKLLDGSASLSGAASLMETENATLESKQDMKIDSHRFSALVICQNQFELSLLHDWCIRAGWCDRYAIDIFQCATAQLHSNNYSLGLPGLFDSLHNVHESSTPASTSTGSAFNSMDKKPIIIVCTATMLNSHYDPHLSRILFNDTRLCAIAVLTDNADIVAEAVFRIVCETRAKYLQELGQSQFNSSLVSTFSRSAFFTDFSSTSSSSSMTDCTTNATVSSSFTSTYAAQNDINNATNVSEQHLSMDVEMTDYVTSASLSATSVALPESSLNIGCSVLETFTATTTREFDNNHHPECTLAISVKPLPSSFESIRSEGESLVEPRKKMAVFNDKLCIIGNGAQSDYKTSKATLFHYSGLIKTIPRFEVVYEGFDKQRRSLVQLQLTLDHPIYGPITVVSHVSIKKTLCKQQVCMLMIGKLYLLQEFDEMLLPVRRETRAHQARQRTRAAPRRKVAQPRRLVRCSVHVLQDDPDGTVRVELIAVQLPLRIDHILDAHLIYDAYTQKFCVKIQPLRERQSKEHLQRMQLIRAASAMMAVAESSTKDEGCDADGDQIMDSSVRSNVSLSSMLLKDDLHVCRRLIPQELRTRPHSDSEGSCVYYCYGLQITGFGDSGDRCRLALLTGAQLPITSIPNTFEIYANGQCELSDVNILPLSATRLTREQLTMAKNWQARLFGIINSNGSVLEQPWYEGDSSCAHYIILPLRNDHPTPVRVPLAGYSVQNGNINDFASRTPDILSDLAFEQVAPAELPFSDSSDIFSWNDIKNELVENMIEHLEDVSSVINCDLRTLRKDSDSFQEEARKMRDSIIMTTYNSKFYAFIDIQNDITAISSFPKSQYDTYQAYMQQRWRLPVDPNMAMLCVRKIHFRPQNALIERPAQHAVSMVSNDTEHDTSTTATEILSENNSSGKSTDIYLCSQYCKVLPISLSMISYLKLIPSIMYRIQQLLVVVDLQRRIGLNSSFSLLRAAITGSGVDSKCNYERLEFLGDTFLKHAFTEFLVYLFARGKFADEQVGLFSDIKRHGLSNHLLGNLGRAVNLDQYIDLQPFRVNEYAIAGCISYRKLIHMTSRSSGLRTANVAGSRESSEEGKCAAVSDTSQSFICSIHQLANVCEALIGVHYLCGGEAGGRLAMAWLGLPSLDLPQLLHHMPSTFAVPDASIFLDGLADSAYKLQSRPIPDDVLMLMARFINAPCAAQTYNRRLDPAHCDEFISNFLVNALSQIEERLDYCFKDPVLPLEAFVHTSFKSPHVSTQERLELLGDAVLDQIVAERMCRVLEFAPPSQLAWLRQHLVCTRTWAAITIYHGFDCFVLHNDPSLRDRIENFKQCHLKQQPTEPPKALADLFEAIIGAVYVDSGRDLAVTTHVFYTIADVIWRIPPTRITSNWTGIDVSANPPLAVVPKHRNVAPQPIIVVV